MFSSMALQSSPYPSPLYPSALSTLELLICELVRSSNRSIKETHLLISFLQTSPSVGFMWITLLGSERLVLIIMISPKMPRPIFRRAPCLSAQNIMKEFCPYRTTLSCIRGWLAMEGSSNFSSTAGHRTSLWEVIGPVDSTATLINLPARPTR